MKSTFSTVKGARKCIEAFLEAWKVKAELNYGHHEINFKFVDAELIDRKPSKPGEFQKMKMESTEYAMVGEETSFCVTRKNIQNPQ